MAYDTYILAKSGAMTAPLKLYTEFKENWQYFFSEGTMTPDSAGEVSKVVSVAATAVRRGPGDPHPFLRRGTQRFHVRYPKSKGSARPGQTYRVAERDPMNPGKYRELRQFSISGNIMDVWAYAIQKAKFQIVLWGPNGWSSEIDGATAGGTLGQAHLATVQAHQAAAAGAAPAPVLIVP